MNFIRKIADKLRIGAYVSAVWAYIAENKARKYIGLPLVVVLVVIAVASTLYSRIEPPNRRYIMYSAAQLVQYDPLLGWANKPDFDGFFQTVHFDTEVFTNHDGMRDKDVGERRGFRVAMLGDDITWGWGVNAGERFSDIIEAEHGIEVLNFAVNGYNSLHYLLQLDRVMSFNPDVVVVVFNVSNDFSNVRNIDMGTTFKPFAVIDQERLSVRGYPIPDYNHFRRFSDRHNLPSITSFALGRWFYFTLLEKHYPTFAWFFGGANKSNPPIRGLGFYRDDMLYKQELPLAAKRALMVNKEILRQIKEKLEQYNVPLLMVEAYNADRFILNDRPNQLFEEQASELGIKSVKLDGVLKEKHYFIRGDGHWNAEAHKVAAKEIATRLLEIRKGLQEDVGGE